jgi:hypothetical protein
MDSFWSYMSAADRVAWRGRSLRGQFAGVFDHRFGLFPGFGVVTAWRAVPLALLSCFLASRPSASLSLGRPRCGSPGGAAAAAACTGRVFLFGCSPLWFVPLCLPFAFLFNFFVEEDCAVSRAAGCYRSMLV